MPAPIYGTDYDDFVLGTPDRDIIYALGGNDVVIAREGNDEIYGGEGDDDLDGGDGDDIVDGGEGDDGAVGGRGNDLMYGDAGNDSFFGEEGDDQVYGGEGHDFLMGHQGNDILMGGSGNDLLRGGTGDDLLDGGDGYDRVSFFGGPSDMPPGGVTVSLLLQGAPQNTGHGMDTLVGIEALSGTFYDDTLIGDHGTNWLIGGGGAGGAGNDSLYGMGGDDLLEVNSGNHWLDGGDGEDTVSFAGLGLILGGVNASLFAQGGAQSTGQGSMTLTGIENLSGTPFADGLVGDNGDNLLAGGAGDDALVGASGNDRLYGDGAVMADVPPGVGTSGPPTLFEDLGGGGNDSLDAGAGDDILVGGGGNDLLQGGPGNDTLDGGAGTDTASFATGVGPVFVDLNAGIASGGDGNDTLVSVENALGSVFNDQLYAYSGGSRLVGNGGNDLIFGRRGDDWLQGNSGNDQLRGDAGNDRLEGGDGVDLMFGGTGADSFDGGDGFDRVGFFHFSATQGVVASLVTQTILNDGFGNAETMVSVEALGPGTALADHFTGDDNANYLLGDRGDTLIGNGGDDTIQLGSAPALIDGGDGVDTITQFIGDLIGYLVPDNNGDGLADLVFATRGVEVDLSRGTIVDDGSGNSGTLISIENVGGSGLDDTLIGDDGVNDLTSFAGDDLLEGGLGDDTLDGGGGLDTARYASASGAVFVDLASGTAGGAAGNDILIGIENVSGSAFGDEIVGDAGGNVLAGEDGDDFIAGEGGDDDIDGGDGDDTIEGGLGDDLLFGGLGHDALRGRDGADELHGGDGDDFLNGGVGDDRVDGGDGFDRATYSSGAIAGVTVDLRIDGVAQNTGSQGMDILTSIEHVSGTRFSDVLRGDEGDNWIWGGSDGSGVTGDDDLRGGGGNDLIQVGTGNHFLRGGSGADTLSLHGNGTDITAAGVTVSLALQGAAQNTEQGMMNLKGFENLSGSLFDDALGGNGADNLLAGDSGNDNLSGGSGDDTLYGDGRLTVDTHQAGGSGPIVAYADVADVAYPEPWPGTPGGAGNDMLDGGKGDDTLVGGGGDDMLTGGQGRDTFTFGANDGDDRITDFQNKDTIRFEGIAGVDDFGDLTLTRIGHDTLISWGTGDSILVEGTKPNQLHASDFLFG
jgi:Ca2+-binding RTX toxin-like protein